MAKISERIKEIREKRGMTVDELAGKCTMNPRTIEMIEAGKQKVEYWTAMVIAGALGVDKSELGI